MSISPRVVSYTVASLLVFCSVLGAAGADWPQWGGSPARNMVSVEERLPSSFEPGKKRPDGSGIDMSTTRNVRWAAKLGTETYSSPVVASHRVLIGTNDAIDDDRTEPTGGGALLCFDERTGELQWKYISPRREDVQGRASSDFERMNLGICSTPCVEGDRVYVVTNRAEVVCLDIDGMADGNDGAADEAVCSVPKGHAPLTLDEHDADVVWRFDLLNLPTFPHDATCGSPLVWGDYVYVATGNGINGTEGVANANEDAAVYPEAPSLIAIDKRTGKLAAVDDAKIGHRVFHGQWSSPAAAEVKGEPLIFFGGGDGFCYAFSAFRPDRDSDGLLRTIWKFDCNPHDYRFRDGKPMYYWLGDKRFNKEMPDDGSFASPCEIIATPVFHENRIYVAIGQDPMHGRGRGALHCIDATQKGDVTETARRWVYTGLERSLSTVAVDDGLVYCCDYPGRLHCLDAETGRLHWIHEAKAPTWTSPLVADGKIFLGTRKSLWILKAGPQLEVLSQINLGSALRSTPAAANNTLYVASQRYLWAVEQKDR